MQNTPTGVLARLRHTHTHTNNNAGPNETLAGVCGGQPWRARSFAITFSAGNDVKRAEGLHLALYHTHVHTRSENADLTVATEGDGRGARSSWRNARRSPREEPQPSGESTPKIVSIVASPSSCPPRVTYTYIYIYMYTYAIRLACIGAASERVSRACKQDERKCR